MCSNRGKRESRSSFTRDDSDIGHPWKCGQNSQEYSDGDGKAPALQSWGDSAGEFHLQPLRFSPVMQAPSPGASQIHLVLPSPEAESLQVWGSHSDTFSFFPEVKFGVPFNAGWKSVLVTKLCKNPDGFHQTSLASMVRMMLTVGTADSALERWMIGLGQKGMEKDSYNFLKYGILSWVFLLCCPFP